MAESKAHRKAKRRAAGRSGETEKKISGGRRLDAATRYRATEVERSSSMKRLLAAARRLKDSRKRQKVLQVPQKNLLSAIKAMREVGASGTVKNMSGTRRRHVAKRKR